MSDIPESAPISLPTIEPKTVDPKGQTLSNEQRQIISRCITMTTARAKAYLTWDRDKLVARIAELEARLELAEKVVEAAEWFSGKIHWSAAHTIGVEFELKTFREALAAWMAQKH